MLYRIEVKNGKRFRTRVGTKQGPKAAGNRDCYRCGRPGHFGRDCKARSHKDGGPVRMPTGKGRSAAALDDDEEAGDPAGPAAPRNPAPAATPPTQTPAGERVQLGGLDLCALDAGPVHPRPSEAQVAGPCVVPLRDRNCHGGSGDRVRSWICSTARPCAGGGIGSGNRRHGAANGRGSDCGGSASQAVHGHVAYQRDAETRRLLAGRRRAGRHLHDATHDGCQQAQRDAA